MSLKVIKARMLKEHRDKISKAMKGNKHLLGYKFSEKSKQKISDSKKGKRLSEETRRKIGLAHKGKPSGMLGKKHTIDSKRKTSERMKGENHPCWKGGITPINAKIRRSFEYRLWRTAVFERDNYTCVWCKQRGGTLNADHIKRFADYPELRFAIDNGRTLCLPCHKTTYATSN